MARGSMVDAHLVTRRGAGRGRGLPVREQVRAEDRCPGAGSGGREGGGRMPPLGRGQAWVTLGRTLGRQGWGEEREAGCSRRDPHGRNVWLGPQRPSLRRPQTNSEW